MKANEIGEEALGRLVGRFYDKVRADALLGPVFEPAIKDWPEHLEQLHAFWSSVMLGSGRYKGRPLPAHLRHWEALTPARFERWLVLWGETAEELFLPQEAAALRAKAKRIAQSLSEAVRTRAGSVPAVPASAGGRAPRAGSSAAA